MKPVVFAVSAVPGAGKSSLVFRLKSRFPRCRTVAHDDFATATQMPFDQVLRWFERGGDCNEFDMSPLVNELQRALAETDEPTPLFLETHFGRRHAAIAPLVDKLVWIEVPLDLALARQVQAFTSEALRGKGGGVDYLRWQHAYLEQYQTHLHRMYARQRDDIRPTADLVVDGRLPPDELASLVATFVARALPG